MIIKRIYSTVPKSKSQ